MMLSHLKESVNCVKLFGIVYQHSRLLQLSNSIDCLGFIFSIVYMLEMSDYLMLFVAASRVEQRTSISAIHVVLFSRAVLSIV